MPDWLPYVIGCWALPASALLWFEFPYRAEVGTWRYLRDCIGWPIWMLMILVEITEEARRGNLRK